MTAGHQVSCATATVAPPMSTTAARANARQVMGVSSLAEQPQEDSGATARP